MYICICHSVTDKAIHNAVQDGHDSLEAIQEQLKASTCCGCCEPHVLEEIHKARTASPTEAMGLFFPQPTLA
ncbi:MAG: (2Fe-2S)-binding protein [Thiothrix sp.]|nr:(2Fe-2S)-binding protein [Thiothrix sp.]HPE61387.1 (2Fe-2S)-binding protein [Thiolinea sp.]